MILGSVALAQNVPLMVRVSARSVPPPGEDMTPTIHDEIAFSRPALSHQIATRARLHARALLAHRSKAWIGALAQRRVMHRTCSPSGGVRSQHDFVVLGKDSGFVMFGRSRRKSEVKT